MIVFCSYATQHDWSVPLRMHYTGSLPFSVFPAWLRNLSDVSRFRCLDIDSLPDFQVLRLAPKCGMGSLTMNAYMLRSSRKGGIGDLWEVHQIAHWVRWIRQRKGNLGLGAQDIWGTICTSRTFEEGRKNIWGRVEHSEAGSARWWVQSFNKPKFSPATLPCYVLIYIK